MSGTDPTIEQHTMVTVPIWWQVFDAVNIGRCGGVHKVQNAHQSGRSGDMLDQVCIYHALLNTQLAVTK